MVPPQRPLTRSWRGVVREGEVRVGTPEVTFWTGVVLRVLRVGTWASRSLHEFKFSRYQKTEQNDKNARPGLRTLPFFHLPSFRHNTYLGIYLPRLNLGFSYSRDKIYGETRTPFSPSVRTGEGRRRLPEWSCDPIYLLPPSYTRASSGVSVSTGWRTSVSST